MTPLQATVRIDRAATLGRVAPEIYGSFLESSFFGNIEGGVLDEASELSRPDGFRTDVLAMCKELGVPVVRWPGGNFTSPYHWEDGIGPRDERPRRLELAWGLEESNRFGTDEFLAWCEEAGTAPFLVHSCRDVDEAVRWVEYTNYGGDTAYTRRRAANGRAEPYGVRYWGIGNEVYGPWQMGYRSADEYAAAAREHARFMRLVDPDLSLVAVGIPWQQEQWTRPVLERVGGLVDYLSLHLYAASTHLRGDDDDYDATVAQSLYFEQRIHETASLVAELAGRVGLDHPPALALDEWTIRHLEPDYWPEPQPSADGGVEPRECDVDGASSGLRVNRWSPRTLADALFYAGVFNALHRASGLAAAPRMANNVNLVNANGLVVARPDGAVRSAAYHVWDLYQNHTGTVALAADVQGPARTTAVRQGDNRDGDGGFETRPATVPYLDVSVTLGSDRRTLYVAAVNRHRTDAVRTRLAGDGLPQRARVHDIGAGSCDVLASNSLSAPDTVRVDDRGEVDLADGCYDFPPHSVTSLAFAL